MWLLWDMNLTNYTHIVCLYPTINVSWNSTSLKKNLNYNYSEKKKKNIIIVNTAATLPMFLSVVSKKKKKKGNENLNHVWINENASTLVHLFNIKHFGGEIYTIERRFLILSLSWLFSRVEKKKNDTTKDLKIWWERRTKTKYILYIWCEKLKVQGNEGKRNLIKNNNFIYF